MLMISFFDPNPEDHCTFTWQLVNMHMATAFSNSFRAAFTRIMNPRLRGFHQQWAPSQYFFKGILEQENIFGLTDCGWLICRTLQNHHIKRQETSDFARLDTWHDGFVWWLSIPKRWWSINFCRLPLVALDLPGLTNSGRGSLRPHVEAGI